jgi:mono/diheme cytochrome c family protein
MRKRLAVSGWRLVKTRERANARVVERPGSKRLLLPGVFTNREPRTANRWLMLAIAASLWLGPAPARAFPWDKDMVDQPSAKPQKSPSPPPPNSVPTTGRENVPDPTTEKELFKAKDEAAAIRNPVPATSESVARGAYLYQVNCLVCHGKEGRGDGPVGRKFDPSPVDLNKDYTQSQADGQLFFTLTRGRVAMPFYRDALSQQERWDVINFLRSEFGAKRRAQ